MQLGLDYWWGDTPEMGEGSDTLLRHQGLAHAPEGGQDGRHAPEGSQDGCHIHKHGHGTSASPEGTHPLIRGKQGMPQPHRATQPREDQEGCLSLTEPLNQGG